MDSREMTPTPEERAAVFKEAHTQHEKYGLDPELLEVLEDAYRREDWKAFDETAFQLLGIWMLESWMEREAD